MSVSLARLSVFGLVLHLVFFYSIFDIYFSSPLVQNLEPLPSEAAPLARRLVLFVADGLRADKFFELNKRGESRAPFLRDVILREGAWGISHTRVPTESRPGHVALIAGFYEDVSAITKGWKENSVEFDSVFNQSRETWSWGSADILPMFAKGATGDHVHTYTYPSHWQDFGANASVLDEWVFEEATKFFAKGQSDEKLFHQLQQDKIVFFLHLLGIDTNGHGAKPHSAEYLANIELVDAEIKKFVSVVEKFYAHDAATAYVMTADHGMTDWGSHGAGDPEETMTPLVAWGAGVRKPVKRGHPHLGPEERLWGLSNVDRADVHQADVCALMSALLGSPFPVNSHGIVPLEYIQGTDETKAKILHSNARQISAQFNAKMTQKRRNTFRLLFKEFKPLARSHATEMLSEGERLIFQGRFLESMSMSHQLIYFALEGLRYYHTYDRVFLGLSVALGFIGWSAYVVILVLRQHSDLVPSEAPTQELKSVFTYVKATLGVLHLVWSCAFFSLYLFLWFQSSPVMYYVYSTIPLCLWYLVVRDVSVFREALIQVYRNGLLVPTIVIIVGLVVGTELLVAAFFFRHCLSIMLVIFAVWPMLTNLRHDAPELVMSWIASCLLTAVFPLLPVVGKSSNFDLVLVAGVIALLILAYCFRLPQLHLLDFSVNRVHGVRSRQVALVSLAQIFVTLVAVFATHLTMSNAVARTAVPVIVNVFSWIILLGSALVPMLGSDRLMPRLLHISASCIAPYLLMSRSHEALFLISLCILMFFWIALEHRSLSISRLTKPTLFEISVHWPMTNTVLDLDRNWLVRPLEAEDVRRSFFFIFFIILAFFGTGNIASINSFDPSFISSFVTVFNPFLMGGLLLVKILIPLVVVAASLKAVQVMTMVPINGLFLLILFISDAMALHFFFLVKDDGSWLDIGTSISHYVIVMSTILAVIIFFKLASLLTTVTLTLCPSNPKPKPF